MEAAEGERINVREARKRRILETGSDRMALITGRIQSLPYSPRSPSLRRTLGQSSSFPERSSLNSNFSGQSHAGWESDKNDKTVNAEKDTIIIKEKKIEEEEDDTISKEIKSIGEHTLRVKYEISQKVTNNESQIRPKDATIGGEDEISRSSGGTISATSTTRCADARITPKLISHCIMSSEPARSVCSLVVALLVASSRMNLVKYGSFLVASRPLCILLITNISIVAAVLQLERKNGEREEEEFLWEDARSWGGAVKVLEAGLVVYHSVRALFIDFSIYSVVVVCGLSFA